MRGGWFGASGRLTEGEAVVELALVAAWAEGPLPQEVWDRLARALATIPMLEGLDWDWLVGRSEQLEGEAPLFSEARRRLAGVLLRSEQPRFAFDFARRLLGPAAAEDAEVILADIAGRVGIDPPFSADPPLPGVVRARFDDPEDPSEVPFDGALARAHPTERRLLLFKLRAARMCLHRLGDGARLIDFGRRLPWGLFLFRADAIVEAPDGRYTCRFLANGEALYPAEHRLLSDMAKTLEPHQRILVASEGPPCPPDNAFLGSLAPEVLRTIILPQGQAWMAPTSMD